MNLDLIFKIIKTLLGKDTDPQETAKPWYLKRRYYAVGILALSGYIYQRYGLVWGNDTQEILLNNLQVIANSIPALVSAISGIYAVILGIKGQIGQQKKLGAKVLTEGLRADQAESHADAIKERFLDNNLVYPEQTKQGSAPRDDSGVAQDTSMEGLQ